MFTSVGSRSGRKQVNVLQIQIAVFGAVSTGTTVLPVDNSIPQSSEGDQFMTIDFTPINPKSNIIVEAVALLACTAARTMTAAIFRDSIADAIGAAVGVTTTGGNTTIPVGCLIEKIGSRKTITFKVRCGYNSTAGQTTTFNGGASAVFFGSINKSYIKVTEYLP